MVITKSYSVTIDGKAYSLKYGPDEREAIEVSFPKPDGTPGSLGQIVQGHLLNPGSLRVQATTLWNGLRHHKGLTYDRVRNAMVEAMQGDGVGPMIEAARKALLAQGILGKAVDPEPPVVADEDESGKAEAATVS